MYTTSPFHLHFCCYMCKPMCWHTYTDITAACHVQLPRSVQADIVTYRILAAALQCKYRQAAGLSCKQLDASDKPFKRLFCLLHQLHLLYHHMNRECIYETKPKSFDLTLHFCAFHVIVHLHWLIAWLWTPRRS